MRTFLLPALLLPAIALGQSGPGHLETTVHPFVFGDVVKFRSAALGTDRVLNIHLPEGYADSSRAYPVIYLLDGSENEDFPHIAGLVQFLSMCRLFPPSIVVGIANTGRSRYHDFTPPTANDSDLAWVPEGGGSAAFIRFLGQEVKPLVQARYRCTAQAMLIGQSLGGLLGMEVLFTRPELFDDYVLVSPSLWWNNGALAAHADQWVKAHDRLPKRVFVAYAPDDAMMLPQIDAVARAFKGHAKAPLAFRNESFPKESHLTILHQAGYRALEWLGAGGLP